MARVARYRRLATANTLLFIMLRNVKKKVTRRMHLSLCHIKWTYYNICTISTKGKKAGPVIHLKRPELNVCLEFCKKFNQATGRTLVYRGESLGVIGAKAFELMTLGNKRKQISEEERDQIKERQGGACARCGGPCHDVDHKVALSAFGKDDPENYEYLCVDCHTLKT